MLSYGPQAVAFVLISYRDVYCLVHNLAYPRTSDYRWTEYQRNVIFQNIIEKDDLGILKVIKISLPNLDDMDFRSTEKSLVGLALLLPTALPL